MRSLKYSSRFKRDYELCKKRDHDMQKMQDILVEPVWILIYKLEGNDTILLAAMETHSDILKVKELPPNRG